MKRAIALMLLLWGCSSNPTPTPATSGGSSGSCDQSTGERVDTLLTQNQKGCNVNDDCTTIDVNLSCFGLGQQPVVKSDADSVSAQLQQIDQKFCPESCQEGTNGGLGGTVACISGTCVFGDPDAGGPGLPGYGGYFHELGIPEALNLEIYPSGTYEAALYGCDVQEAFGGTWYQVDPDGGPLAFDHGSGETLVSLGDGGVLFTNNSLFFGDGGTDTLAPGAVCAICDGGGGPQGLVPCDHPFGF